MTFLSSSGCTPLRLLVIALPSMLCARPASAQESTPAPADQSTLAEVVVTSGRTGAALLQETPLAISAFSNADLQERGATSVEQLARFTPGLTWTQNAQQAQPSIRGIGSTIYGIGGDSSVTVQVDGVYIGRPTGATLSLLDVDHIEILRGPQGTLYGRNATAGTINVTTRSPSDVWKGEVRFGYGEFSTYETSGFVSGPLISSGKLQASIAATATGTDGFITNVGSGTPDRLGQQRHFTTRGKLRWVPTDAIDIVAALDVHKARDPGIQWFDKPAAPLGLGERHFDDFYTVAHSGDSYGSNDDWGASLTATFDATSSLRLTNITAYRDNKYLISADIAATSVPFLWENPVDNRAHQWTEELQAAWKLHGFKLVGGFYLFHEDGLQLGQVRVPTAAIVSNLNESVKTDSIAGYAQGEYRFADSWSVIIGGRYTHDRKDIGKFGDVRTLSPDLPTNEFAPIADLVSGTSYNVHFDGLSWSAFTPRASLNYQPSRALLLYASVSKGYKAGGADLSNVPGLNTYGPETVLAYELGAKQILMNGAARLNSVAFYYDYKGYQSFLATAVNASSGAASIGVQNAPKVTVYGLEVEGDLLLGERFGLSAVATWLPRANYSESFQTPDTVENFYRQFSGAPPLILDANGHRLTNAPHFSGTLGAQYTYPLSDAVEISGRADYSYQDLVYFGSADNNPILSQKGYGLLNLRIALASRSAASDAWEAALELANATGREYLTGGVVSGAPVVRLGNPRSWFLVVSKKFNL